MIGKTDLVEAKLKQYFYAIKELNDLDLELTALKQTMNAHSPNLTGEHGYNGTRDNKNLNYSIKKKELDEKILAKTNECDMYYHVLHLYELEDNDITFLSLLYKEKLTQDEVARKMYYTDKSYVSRKKDALLERLAKYF